MLRAIRGRPHAVFEPAVEVAASAGGLTGSVSGAPGRRAARLPRSAEPAGMLAMGQAAPPGLEPAHGGVPFDHLSDAMRGRRDHDL
jgi:hypothetical protein